jgi:hypothetical protein
MLSCKNLPQPLRARRRRRQAGGETLVRKRSKLPAQSASISRRDLRRQQGRSAGRLVTMSRGGLSVDGAGGVAADDHRGATMTAPRASHFVAHTCDGFACCVGGAGTLNHNAPVVGFIAYNYERFAHNNSAKSGGLAFSSHRRCAVQCVAAGPVSVRCCSTPSRRNSTWPKSLMLRQLPPQVRPTERATAPYSA